MDAKTFFKRFHWETVFPAALLALSGIAALASATDNVAFSVSTGIFFVLFGAAELCAFFFGKEADPAYLLSGVVGLCAALWLFITLNNTLYVSGIAAAILALLRAVGEILSAVTGKRGRGYTAAAIVLAVLYAGAAATLFADPFKDGRILYLAGALLLFMGIARFVLTLCTGLFIKEEILVYKKVRK